VGEQYDTVAPKLAVRHYATSAHRALPSRGLDARPAVRDRLVHQSADVRYWCCQFLDHFLTSRPRTTWSRCPATQPTVCVVRRGRRWPPTAVRKVLVAPKKEKFCSRRWPSWSLILAPLRARAVGVVGRRVHTNRGAEFALLQAMRSDLSFAGAEEGARIWFCKIGG
jgi:hypothetical protein